jgi:hypothetical protein
MKRTCGKIRNSGHVHFWKWEVNQEIFFGIIGQNSWTDIGGISISQFNQDINITRTLNWKKKKSFFTNTYAVWLRKLGLAQILYTIPGLNEGLEVSLTNSETI